MQKFNEGKAGRSFYVAVNGNDSWSGILPVPNVDGSDGPFATVGRAVEAVRQAKQFVQDDDKEFTVYLREGVHRLSSTLGFTPEDSGTEKSPVLYRNFPGETPVVSGGVELPLWTRTNDALWTVDLSGMMPPERMIRQLFIGKNRRNRARVPETGYFLSEDDGAGLKDDEPRFICRDGDMNPNWAKSDDVEVRTYQNWVLSRSPITGLDESSREVRLGGGKMAPSGIESICRYFVENVPEGLKTPGAWYVDRAKQKLHYHPLPEDDINISAEISMLETLIQIEGDASARVRNIHFSGIHFQHTSVSEPDNAYNVQAACSSSSAFSMNSAQGIRVSGCRFSGLGNYAVGLERECCHNEISSNEIIDTGSGGIWLGEDLPIYGEETSKRVMQDTAKTENNLIADNEISYIGQIDPAGVGIIIFQSGANRVVHNHIHHCKYSGISIGWSWGYDPTPVHDNLIGHNHIHHIGGGMLNDLGGIYLLGLQPGTVIENNRIHHIRRHSYGGWGIYTDQGSSEILFRNNIIHDAQSGAVNQHFGKNNRFVNNILIGSKEDTVLRNHDEPHLSFEFRNNIIVSEEASPLGGDWGGVDHFAMESNLYFRTDASAEDQFSAAAVHLGVKPWGGRYINAVLNDGCLALGLKDFVRLPPSCLGAIPGTPVPSNLFPEDAEWESGLPLPAMVRDDGSNVEQEETQVRVLKDEEHLYFRFDSLHTRDVPDQNNPMCATDRIELFLRPDMERELVFHAIIEINGKASFFIYRDSRMDEAGMEVDVDPGWQKSVEIAGTGWATCLKVSTRQLQKAVGGEKDLIGVFGARLALVPHTTFSEWQGKGHDLNSLVADPQFVDPANGDFRLKETSPAFKVGFAPIDTTHVGIRLKSRKEQK